MLSGDPIECLWGNIETHIKEVFGLKRDFSIVSGDSSNSNGEKRNLHSPKF